MSKSRITRSKHSRSYQCAAFPRTPEAHQRADGGNGNSIPSNLFADLLLREAVTRPGILSEAYHAFHAFSLGNQILAASQLIERGLSISPSPPQCPEKQRPDGVEGGKAIRLFMPVTIKRQDREEETGIEQEIQFQTFMLKPHWFSLDQTDGEPLSTKQKIPHLGCHLGNELMGIEEIPFEMLDGNCRWATPQETGSRSTR